MSNLNLMVHCGGNRAERDQVFKVLPPNRTETHVPVAHKTLISHVEHSLNSVGLKVKQEAHALAHEGLRYFGMMEVEALDSEREYSTVIGLRNSNDKAFPAGFVIGSGVFVCDNLCFSGEESCFRRHTSNVLLDLPERILGALERVGAAQAFQDQRIETYKTTEITDSQANNLIFEAFDSDIITAGKVVKVREEWNAPRHHEFKQDGKTAWRLMNSFTEILKPRKSGMDLFKLPKRGMALHNILDRACGLTEADALPN